MGWLPAEMAITGPRILPLVCTVMQDFWFTVTVLFLGLPNGGAGHGCLVLALSSRAPATPQFGRFFLQVQLRTKADRLLLQSDFVR